jgi:hypothetical protein
VVKKFLEFFDIDSFVYHEFVLPAQCVTCHFNKQVLQRLLQATSATSGRESGFCITYSSDLALSAFCLFPTLKIGLKGTSFATMEDIKSNVMAKLCNIPKECFRVQVREGVSVHVCKDPILNVIM